MLSVVLLGAPITSAVFPGDAHPLVNGSLWTIAYEFRCYLLLALVGMAGLLRRRWVLLAITMILILLPHWKPLKGWLWTGDLAGVGEASMILRLLPFFAVGACFYIFRDLVRFRPRLLWTAIGAMIAIQIVDARHMELGMYVFGSYVIFYLGQCQFTWLQSWRMPDISYGGVPVWLAGGEPLDLLPAWVAVGYVCGIAGDLRGVGMAELALCRTADVEAEAPAYGCVAGSVTPSPSRMRKAASSRIGTLSEVALSSFDPASSPATR